MFLKSEQDRVPDSVSHCGIVIETAAARLLKASQRGDISSLLWFPGNLSFDLQCAGLFTKAGSLCTSRAVEFKRKSSSGPSSTNTALLKID